MKYIAIAALIGAIDIQAKNLNQLDNQSNQDKLFMMMNDQENDSELIQTDKILEKAQGWSGYKVSHNKFPGTQNEFGNWVDPYTRVNPEVFQGDIADEGQVPLDRYTQNLIDNYAVEGISKQQEPTGRFFITKEHGKDVAKEILCTHYQKCGAEAEKWLGEYSDNNAFGSRWEEAWKYWDVLGKGKIDAIGSSVMFRHLCLSLGSLDI